MPEAITDHVSGREHRDLGDVTGKINGKWQEFRATPKFGAVATGCKTGCSAATNSEPLGSNNSPWTFDTGSCTVLAVVEGYKNGNAYYNVFDNGVRIFTTSEGNEVGKFTKNPAVAWNDPDYGKGRKKLQPGFHSIVIKTKWMDEDDSFDGGWFRIRTVAC